jgi:hypothetical protein
MYEWRRLEEKLQKLEKYEFSLFDLEAGVKNRITHQRKKWIFFVSSQHLVLKGENGQSCIV